MEAVVGWDDWSSHQAACGLHQPRLSSQAWQFKDPISGRQGELCRCDDADDGGSGSGSGGSSSSGGGST